MKTLSNSGLFSDSELALTSEQELRRFLEHQQAGLDRGYKCPRCRDCPACRKGAGFEKMSMRQEAENEVIKDSIHLDKELKKISMKYPVIGDISKIF